MSKKVQLILTTLAIAVTGGLAMPYLGDLVFGHDIAKYIVIPLSFIFGLNARAISEKLLGFTLQEAMKESRG